jgi:hypothetical protein
MSEEPEDRDPADEIDVDLTSEEDIELRPADAAVPETEYLGSYESVAAYLRAMLEPEVTPACAWILDHLDYEAVRRRWEGDGSRLLCEHGHIYRLAGRPVEA